MKKIASYRAILRMTKTAKEVCPKHHCHYVYLAGKARPFCPKCFAEEQAKKKADFDRKNTRELVTKFLYRESLIDRKNDWQRNFKNFEAGKGSRELYLKNGARRIAYRYIQEREKKFNTVLTGPPGTGKTHLAISMIQAINDNSKPPQKCLYVNVNDLFERIYASFDDSTELWTKAHALEVLPQASVLVLDDLGTESYISEDSRSASPFIQKLLYSISNSDTRLIITTNLSMAQLRRAYAAKIVSRLLAGSSKSILDFSGIKDKRF